MPANLADHLIIQAVKTISGNTPLTDAIAELAGRTFLEGVPVMTTAAGFVQEWDANVAAAAPGVGISGISKQPGANLPSNGAGAPVAPFGSVGFPGTTSTFGSVQYEPSAVNIAMGSPFSDGRAIFEVINPDTIFLAQFDNASGTVPADYTPVQADINKEYGLTKDSTGHWYVDKAKATAGTNTVVIIRGLDPTTGSVVNGNVLVSFKDAIMQPQH
jgi:hypothetical protein